MRYTLGQRYTFKTLALLKSAIIYARYSLGQRYTFKTLALLKSAITYARYSIGNNYISAFAHVFFQYSVLDYEVIYITLPDVKITDTDVEIESLDYIFENDKANTENVSAKAYKACITDVENEASTEDAIFELAEENAQNIIKALVNPFAVQYDTEYEIVFN